MKQQQQNQPIEVLLRNSRLNRNAYPERNSPHCLKASRQQVELIQQNLDLTKIER